VAMACSMLAAFTAPSRVALAHSRRPMAPAQRPGVSTVSDLDFAPHYHAALLSLLQLEFIAPRMAPS
jgi:hypothetical protein